jgi:hypothetical protein
MLALNKAALVQGKITSKFINEHRIAFDGVI